MSLLAGGLGYAQLTEPVRFRAAWEQAASLRLRQGDTSVLTEYDQHGRIRGGDPEQMMDAAAAAYLALTLDGVDTLLMAAGHALRRELNRRIREDLITVGAVQPGPAVKIADGTWASPGDLIICTRNDHAVEAGEPGRILANGDLLRVEAVTADGLLVRRALDADPNSGRRRWTDRRFVFNLYRDAELGYAVTDHAAQSRTVTVGLAVITGTEDRQHAYVALSRGTEINLAYVFTASPRTADPAPAPRPAPELARYDRRAAGPGPQPAAAPTPPEALTVPAGVWTPTGFVDTIRSGTMVYEERTGSGTGSQEVHPGIQGRGCGAGDKLRPSDSGNCPEFGHKRGNAGELGEHGEEVGEAEGKAARYRRARAAAGTRGREPPAEDGAGLSKKSRCATNAGGRLLAE